MLNTETTKEAEIIEPVEAFTASGAVASARRKPDLVPVPAGQQPAVDQHPASYTLPPWLPDLDEE